MDYNIHLSDGSVVYLNSATILSFPMKFTGNTREITINGEAYLEVAKDATHPFIVNLPHGSVQVLGTEFNVNSYDSGVVKVALVQGSVNMQMDNHTLHLTPGKEGVYKNNNLAVKPFDEQTTLGWRQGIYYFDNATLRQIVEVLPRWFGMQVQMDNEAKASEHFTGRVYRNQPITDFLDNLKSTTTVDYFIRDSVVHFR
jgi:ferric-dicitrate binding protein FerR (iron transport regulator)